MLIIKDVSTDDRIIWQGYPAWSKFAWLYLVSFVAGSRGLRILWQGATGWEGWLAGALALLVCAGPDPGLFACATCDLSADADTEPVSVLVVRHPSTGGGKVINILFAHAACSPSAVTESDTQIDVELILGRHSVERVVELD